ncbi:SGNH/GDSL hydrolase family protein [Streptomyces sp. NPDC045431]|uniref:SGNH/GDSL hydrolase family protein n=1 Tax=Streptomyces sp. NPDC045431 TaxID=3155613 RepID=UPI0033F999E8
MASDGGYGVLLTKRVLRTRVVRLPEAEGDSGTTHGTGPALRLLVLGDSTAAGVGAARHSEALAGHLATAVTALTGRGVDWRVAARSGATVRTVRRDLLNRLTEPTRRWSPDLIVVTAGMNDALRRRRPRAFRADVLRLVRDIGLRLDGEVPVVLVGLPDTDRLAALPRALRAPLGVYVRLLDRQLRVVARRAPHVVHLPSGGPPHVPGDWISRDRFHPSPTGYRAWARIVAAGVATVIDATRTSRPAGTGGTGGTTLNAPRIAP